MKKIKFEWDPAKAEKNLKKYGVAFDEATTIFRDRDAIFFDDLEHSQKEKRELAIGRSSRARLLTCFIVRTPETTRIISARVSTHRERQEYDDSSESE